MKNSKAEVAKAATTQSQGKETTPSRSQPTRFGLEASFLRLHQTIGNRAVGQMLQAKLRVNEPGDKYEQEADCVADIVMRMPEPEVTGISSETRGIQRKCAACASGQGLCPKCAEEEEQIQHKSLVSSDISFLQRKAYDFNGTEQALQTKEAPGQTPQVTPQIAAGIRGLRGRGKPLPQSARAFFESRFGADLSGVQVHTDARATALARSMNAKAFTVGRDLVFGSGEYAPGTVQGRKLIAHELTHVAQQNHGVISRAVATEYETIKGNLSYGIFDWAITDEEAHEVLAILSGLSERDLANTVMAMDRDGVVNRLLDNVSSEDQKTYAVLIGRIHRYRSTRRTADRIIDRLSYGLFDWAITDEDAHEVLTALMGLDPQQLRTLVAKLVNDEKFDRLMDNISEEDHRRFAAFIQRLRDLRDEFQSLVSAHVSSLRDESRATGSAGSRIRETVASTGYGGQTPTFPNLPPEQQREWQRRAAEAIADVTTSVRGTELEEILSRSRIIFDPEETERLGTAQGGEAFAFNSGANVMTVGRRWVEFVDHYGPRYVWHTIAHELGGHEEFGLTWSGEIMEASWRSLSVAERREASVTSRQLHSAYGYLETELYAELRELPYRLPPQPSGGGDLPYDFRGQAGDVDRQLRRIQAAFGPVVGREIALRFYHRVVQDPHISQQAKALLFSEIQEVFSLFPLTSAVSP